jgi:precorrin-3B synthase
MSANRSRRDLCPGALRPWRAEDGLLVRLRLVGGRTTTESLGSLLAFSQEYGDGAIQLTSRANLQVRGLPDSAAELPPEVLNALRGTGLLPSLSHELVRNIMVSPLTGWYGGRVDLRALSVELDRLICEDPELAGLPGKFLFVLDDGRGDLHHRDQDLGFVALDEYRAQVRIGADWGPVVDLARAPEALVGLAREFLHVRGDHETSPWHVDELEEKLRSARGPAPDLPEPAGPLAHGRHAWGWHLEIPDGLLTAEVFAEFEQLNEVVVTPWRGVLVPDNENGGL